MTSETSNSIESLMKLPFHIFFFQYKMVEDRVKRKKVKKNTTISY